VRADYIIKRIAFAIVTVFIAVTLNFVLFRAVPGDAVSALRCRQCTTQFKEIERRELGLDRPLYQQYLLYVGNLLHGDMGRSLRTQEPVLTELWPLIWNTMPMIILGTLFSIVFGIIVGVLSAWRRDTFSDKAGLYTALGFYSMPTQWLGLLMVLFVARRSACPRRGSRIRPLGC
jgi:ABC-type dipeptide/oligopeptide/nickel transport system permease component